MRKTILAVLAGMVLFGCADKKAQEKALLDSVFKIHNKVMGADERLMNSKMKLDTLLKQAGLPGKDTAAMLSKKLEGAENAMGNWMRKFNGDSTGMSHEEKMVYLADQKKQITAIDSQINVAISESNKYILKVKGK